MKNSNYVSIIELASLLGVSRITIFKRIKSGRIPAEKMGRSYYIARKDLPIILGKVLGENEKGNIKKAVDLAIKQYGETFRLLGKE